MLLAHSIGVYGLNNLVLKEIECSGHNFCIIAFFFPQKQLLKEIFWNRLTSSCVIYRVLRVTVEMLDQKDQKVKRERSSE